LSNRRNKEASASRTTAEIDRRYLTAPEAARYLGVKESWIRKAAGARRIPFVKIGKHNRFRTDDLDRWAEERRVSAEQ
jgi:excisionase family DNA binding protein